MQYYAQPDVLQFRKLELCVCVSTEHCHRALSAKQLFEAVGNQDVWVLCFQPKKIGRRAQLLFKVVSGISEKEGTVAMVDASPEVEALEKEVNHWGAILWASRLDRGYAAMIECGQWDCPVGCSSSSLG